MREKPSGHQFIIQKRITTEPMTLISKGILKIISDWRVHPIPELDMMVAIGTI